jgi:beta-glucosidase
MSAYNRLNGVSCSENPHLLREILKEDWGFDGLVVSDWLGTYSHAAASAGLDLEMPGPGRWLGTALVEMVKDGEISEPEIDDKVMRLLRTIIKAGVEDETSRQLTANDRPEHRRLIRRAGWRRLYC